MKCFTCMWYFNEGSMHCKKNVTSTNKLSFTYLKLVGFIIKMGRFSSLIMYNCLLQWLFLHAKDSFLYIHHYSGVIIFLYISIVKTSYFYWKFWKQIIYTVRIRCISEWLILRIKVLIYIIHIIHLYLVLYTLSWFPFHSLPADRDRLLVDC